VSRIVRETDEELVICLKRVREWVWCVVRACRIVLKIGAGVDSAWERRVVDSEVWSKESRSKSISVDERLPSLEAVGGLGRRTVIGIRRVIVAIPMMQSNQTFFRRRYELSDIPRKARSKHKARSLYRTPLL